MKNLAKKLCFIFILLLAFTNVWAQTESEKFISSDGAFKIELPAQPDKSENLAEQEAYNIGFGKAFTWKIGSAAYAIKYIKIDTFEQPLTNARKATILETMRKSALNSVKRDDTSTSEKTVSFNGTTGKEVQIIFPTGKMIIRIYLVGKRVYWLIAALYDNNLETEGNKVLNSFRILDKAEIVAQKLKETTIAPLPQTPVVAKLKSDAQDENLKGKVKSVTEDAQDNAKAKRERLSENYYDEQGNLVKDISYANGYPFELSSWGYIDGSRVQDNKSFDYNGDEYELLGILTAIDEAASGEQKPYDERYDYKYKYRYDDKGNLVEKWMYLSNGELWMRYVYNFKANQKETAVYDEGGKLNSRRIEILDKNGNVTEGIQYDYTGKLTGKTTHTYELDSRGNWIVQRDFEKATVKGKAVLKASSISYRTITYYD